MRKYADRVALVLGFPMIFTVLLAFLVLTDSYYHAQKLIDLFMEAWDRS